MTGRPEIVVCRDRETLVERAARRIVDAAGATLTTRGRFAVALAGGSTPRPLYERLAEPPHRERLEWERIEVFWGDERCVAPDDPDSNYRMAREALLDRVPIPPARIHRIRGEDPDPDRIATLYERELRRTLETPPGEVPRLDLALLGLGPDGHTASLFPGSAPLLDPGDRLVAAVHASEPGMREPVVERITLTAPCLEAAFAVVFLVAGAGKADAVRAVLEGPRDPARWPAQAVRAGERTAWLLDAAAANRLDLARVP